jgi:hypothetical protein
MHENQDFVIHQAISNLSKTFDLHQYLYPKLSYTKQTPGNISADTGLIMRGDSMYMDTVVASGLIIVALVCVMAVYIGVYAYKHIKQDIAETDARNRKSN